MVRIGVAHARCFHNHRRRHHENAAYVAIIGPILALASFSTLAVTDRFTLVANVTATTELSGEATVVNVPVLMLRG